MATNRNSNSPGEVLAIYRSKARSPLLSKSERHTYSVKARKLNASIKRTGQIHRKTTKK